MSPKTHQAIAKRFKLTKGGKKNKSKIVKRTAGQGHFNTRENGKVGRNKKSDIVGLHSKALEKTVRILLNK